MGVGLLACYFAFEVCFVGATDLDLDTGDHVLHRIMGPNLHPFWDIKVTNTTLVIFTLRNPLFCYIPLVSSLSRLLTQTHSPYVKAPLKISLPHRESQISKNPYGLHTNDHSGATRLKKLGKLSSVLFIRWLLSSQNSSHRMLWRPRGLPLCPP